MPKNPGHDPKGEIVGRAISTKFVHGNVHGNIAHGKDTVHMSYVCVFCHWANTFKYSGVATAKETADLALGQAGPLYYMKVFMRPFNPYAAVELHRPIRPKAWPMSPPVFDYRVAQMSGALEPRGGRWFSRKDDVPTGELDVEWPLLRDIPEEIHIDGRVSWWPPRASDGHVFGGELLSENLFPTSGRSAV